MGPILSRLFSLLQDIDPLTAFFHPGEMRNLGLRSVAQEIFASASGQLQHNFAN
jgi:hypothetical protein